MVAITKKDTMLSKICYGHFEHWVSFVISVRRYYNKPQLQNLMLLMTSYFKNDVILHKTCKLYYQHLGKWCSNFDLQRESRFWYLEGIKKGDWNCYHMLLTNSVEPDELRSITILACKFCDNINRIIQLYLEVRYKYLHKKLQLYILNICTFNINELQDFCEENCYDAEHDMLTFKEAICEIAEITRQTKLQEHLFTLKDIVTKITDEYFKEK